MATEANPFRTPVITSRQAAATIIELINARPISPREDEIEAIVARAAAPGLPALRALSESQARLYEAIQECMDAEKTLNAGIDLPADQYEVVDERYSAALNRVGELAEGLSSTTGSLTDIVLLAQAAYCYADKSDDGIDRGDNTEAAAARVIEAVLQLAGVNYR